MYICAHIFIMYVENMLTTLTSEGVISGENKGWHNKCKWKK